MPDAAEQRRERERLKVLHKVLLSVTDTVATGIAAAYERRFSEDEWNEITDRCLALDWVIQSFDRDSVRRALEWRSIDVSTIVIPLMLRDPRLPGNACGLGFKMREYRNDLVHRKVEEDGRERWAQLDRVQGLLDDSDRLLVELESDEERYELRNAATWVRLKQYEDRESRERIKLEHCAPEEDDETETIRFSRARPRDERFFVDYSQSPRRPERTPPRVPAAATPGEEPLMLSADQRAALDAIEAWYRGPRERRAFTLAGPAGSGKTTLIREALRQLQLVPDEVLLATYTSKAREVMRSKLPDSFAPRCHTLSSLLWKFRSAATPKDGENVRFERIGPKPPQPRIGLVIVDEASMVTERDREQLVRNYRTLFIGDPNQLPPVIPAKGEGSDDRDSGVLLSPDATLKVIHRQDSRSGILVAAGRARAGEQLEFAAFERDGVRMLDESNLDSERFRELLGEHDVILTSRNRTRILVNGIVRRLSGKAQFPGDHDPKPGDLLVCTANHRLPDGGRIENGERIRVLEVIERVSVRRDRPDVEDLRIRGTVEGRDGETFELLVSSQMLAGLHLKGGGREDTRDISGPRSGVARCEWGYALTVHKAQGSEWDRVLVLDDAASDERMDPRRRDYTAFTRARSLLTVLSLANPSRLLAEWDR